MSHASAHARRHEDRNVLEPVKEDPPPSGPVLSEGGAGAVPAARAPLMCRPGGPGRCRRWGGRDPRRRKPPQPEATKTALWGKCAATSEHASERGSQHMHYNATWARTAAITSSAGGIGHRRPQEFKPDPVPAPCQCTTWCSLASTPTHNLVPCDPRPASPAVSMRSERGNWVANYDASPGGCKKSLRCQFGRFYDQKKVGNSSTKSR
jgi:hypothetical protein